VRAELERQRAELPSRPPAPQEVVDEDERETMLSCPVRGCGDEAPEQDCPLCKGLGVVTIEQWRAWRVSKEKAMKPDDVRKRVEELARGETNDTHEKLYFDVLQAIAWGEAAEVRSCALAALKAITIAKRDPR